MVVLEEIIEITSFLFILRSARCMDFFPLFFSSSSSSYLIPARGPKKQTLTAFMKVIFKVNEDIYNRKTEKKENKRECCLNMKINIKALVRKV